MPIARRGRGLGRPARHRAGSWWYDHGRLRMAYGYRAIDVVPIEGPISRDGGDGTIDLVEQGPNLRAIIDVVGGQLHGNDPTRVSVRAKMKPAPGPTRPGAMRLGQPLSGPAEFQTRAVHQQMHRLAPRPWSRQLQGLGPTAQGRVVRNREVEAEQAEDGPDQALGLAQGQAEHSSQGQGCRDGQCRVGGLPTGCGARLGLPG